MLKDSFSGLKFAIDERRIKNLGGYPEEPKAHREDFFADGGYDSDPLRHRLARRGIELIAPHHRNRTRSANQDGRAFRRYKRRWTVERTIGWLGNYRRLVVRYDRSLTIYRGFFHISCLMIVLRKVLQ